MGVAVLDVSIDSLEAGEVGSRALRDGLGEGLEERQALRDVHLLCQRLGHFFRRSVGVGGEERAVEVITVCPARHCRDVAQRPAVNFLAAVGGNRGLRAEVGEMIIQRLRIRDGNRQLAFLDGRSLLDALVNIQRREIARLGGNRVVEVNRRAQFEAGVDDNHLLQTVVGRGVGSGGGEDFDEGVVGRADYVAVLLLRVGFVDFQRLVCRVIDDEALAVGTVHGRMGEERQFHVVVELLAAVGVERPAFRQLLVFSLGSGERERRHEEEAEYECDFI